MDSDGQVAVRTCALAASLSVRALGQITSGATRRQGVRARVCLLRALVAQWCLLTLCALLALSTACGDEAAASNSIESANYFVQNVPPLGCFGSVASVGSCARRADCDPSERCVFDSSLVPDDRMPASLRCAAPVGARVALQNCERGADCQSGLCALTGVCLEPCLRQDDCAETQSCRPVEVRTSVDTLQPVMACTHRLVLPADVEIKASPRGHELRRGNNDVPIPGAAQPALVYLQGDCDRSVDVLTLRSLDLGRNVYDRGQLALGKRSENTVLHDGSSLAALMFPNNPDLAPSLTGLTLGVRSPTAQHVEVVVAARAPGAGILDLNVFYVGGGAEIVEGGFQPGERRVARMLDNLDQRLRVVGMSVGQIREFDVVGALREELSVLEVPSRMVGERRIEGRPKRLDELFKLSSGLDTPGLNIFLIRDMSSYVGIAGGIPGVLGLHGTERSGVALAIDQMGELDDGDLVLLHELGHFLGLFHTTESSGTVLDPLADTAECTSAEDKDEDRELSTDECWDEGADNLMFWTGSGALLTKEQIAVMASSVLLR